MEPVEVFAPIIADPDHLSDTDAMRMARAIADLLTHSPNATIVPSISGYDDDPRELPEIPEVCAFVTKFCAACIFFSVPLYKWKMTNETRGWIAGCLWPETKTGKNAFLLNGAQQQFLGFDVNETDWLKPYKGRTD